MCKAQRRDPSTVFARRLLRTAKGMGLKIFRAFARAISPGRSPKFCPVRPGEPSTDRRRTDFPSYGKNGATFVEGRDLGDLALAMSSRGLHGCATNGTI
jgi:hypothetical protein